MYDDRQSTNYERTDGILVIHVLVTDNSEDDGVDYHFYTETLRKLAALQGVLIHRTAWRDAPG